MPQTTRRPVIAGNWKMHTTLHEGVALAEAIMARADGLEDIDLILCPPFTALASIASVLAHTRIGLGAQNMHWAEEGAYTGEIAARMLLTAGCRYVILGHSERRMYFGETDDIVNRKVRRALDAGLTPIVCVGETRQEREANRTEEVVCAQVCGALSGVSPDLLDRLIFAYEPVWAIGTGLNATSEQANAVHRRIRELLSEWSDAATAQRIRIQYGGSVKPDNAAALLAGSDVDGALVGGASLQADAFIAIARAAL